jgi:sigma-E factor negative regulatory protein RseC
MSERIGIVVSSNKDGWAHVITDRSGGCGGCHSGHSGCRTCLASSKIESRAANDIGARSGDLVKLTLPSSAVFKGTALLYVLPIVAMFAGAFAGIWISGLLGFHRASGALPGSLVGLGLGVWAVILLGRSPSLVRQMTPVITAIVQRSGIPSAPLNANPRHSQPCCG